MNKKFNEYFTSNGYEVIDNRANKIIDGYTFCFITKYLDTGYPLYLHVSFYADNNKKQDIVRDLINQKFKFTRFDLTPYGLGVYIQGYTINTMLKSIDTFEKSISETLLRYQALTSEYSPLSGNKIEKSALLVAHPGVEIEVCEDEAKQIEEELNNIDEQNKKERSYLKGLAGAFLGGLLGSLIFYFVFALGFVSALVALATVFLCQYFYDKFKGKNGNLKIVICSLVSALFILITYIGIYYMAANTVVEEYGGIKEGKSAFATMMEVSEFKQEFSTNLVATILFTILGIAFSIPYVLKKIRSEKSSVKIVYNKKN